MKQMVVFRLEADELKLFRKAHALWCRDHNKKARGTFSAFLRELLNIEAQLIVQLAAERK